MSRFADQLRAIKVYNNWEMLSRFGAENDVCIEYNSPQRWRTANTTVWSMRNCRGLEPPNGFWRVYSKEFTGPRRKSFDQALSFARILVQPGCEYAPSPFGGYLPKMLLKRAKEALK